jgi:hypothetical protein
MRAINALMIILVISIFNFNLFGRNFNVSNTIEIKSLTIDSIPIIYIDSSGQLGLGTHKPQEKLDVHGNINFTGHLIPNGMIGDSGAVMVSKGPLLPPVWDSNFRQGVWDELEDRISFDTKDVEVGKKLVNRGNHGTSPFTIYNEWRPDIESSPDLPPFIFTGGEFSNPSPTQPKNYVFNFGSNLASGGGILESGKPAFGLSFEQRYFIDNIAYNEFHILAVDSNSVQRRPLTTIYAHDGSRNDWSNFLSRFNLHDKDGTKQIYSINTETEDWNYNGNGIRHIFNTPNYQPIWQNINDGTGNAYPLIGYLGAISTNNQRLQLGNPEEPIAVRMGSSLEFGNSNGLDYIGTAFGDGGSDLTFGFTGRRFNTIEFNTSYGIVASFKNTSNQNGWGLGLNAPGALYLSDFSSNTTPFYLSTNMPDNSFRMFSNGNLCLGCEDDTQKLSVNGSLKIDGPFLPNNLAGDFGEVLVSQGPNTPPKWEARVVSRHEEAFVALQGQTEFVISINIEAPTLTKIPLEVYRSGIKLKYNPQTPGFREFNYINNTITLVPCIENDEIEVVYFK